jgi:hypothetical protein
MPAKSIGNSMNMNINADAQVSDRASIRLQNKIRNCRSQIPCHLECQERHLGTNTWQRAQVVYGLWHVRIEVIAKTLGSLLDIPDRFV